MNQKGIHFQNNRHLSTNMLCFFIVNVICNLIFLQENRENTQKIHYLSFNMNTLQVQFSKQKYGQIAKLKSILRLEKDASDPLRSQLIFNSRYFFFFANTFTHFLSFSALFYFFDKTVYSFFFFLLLFSMKRALNASKCRRTFLKCKKQLDISHTVFDGNSHINFPTECLL